MSTAAETGGGDTEATMLTDGCTIGYCLRRHNIIFMLFLALLIIIASLSEPHTYETLSMIHYVALHS